MPRHFRLGAGAGARSFAFWPETGGTASPEPLRSACALRYWNGDNAGMSLVHRAGPTRALIPYQLSFASEAPSKNISGAGVATRIGPI